MTSHVTDALRNGQIPSLDALKALLLNDTTDHIITGDEVQFHTDPADRRILLPQGFGFGATIEILRRKQAEQEEPTNFQRIFKYRVYDGAYAMTQTLKARYGLTLSRGTKTMFGTRPAQSIEIPVAHDKIVTCLWGNIEIPSLDGAQIFLTNVHDDKFGTVFAAQYTGPRKHKAEVEALFNDVDKYLKLHSIYRGKAVAGANQLEFMDLSTFDARQVVFSSSVDEALENLLFGPIRNAAMFRAEGIPLKRALLFHGPFGTGKTSIGMITAQVAAANGWTFITATPSDAVEDVLKTARLYQPAVVLVEDVETEAGDDAEEMSELLDAFDGATAKGTEIIMVLTTNHIELIPKGLLRPGRIDATIEVATLDRIGVEKLIKAVVNPSKLDGFKLLGDGSVVDTIDYDAVYAEMNGFFPAFVKEAVDRAKTWAINRTGTGYVLITKDLVEAARSLHDQLQRMNDAPELQVRDSLNVALGGLVDTTVAKILNRTSVPDEDGDHIGNRLQVVDA